MSKKVWNKFLVNFINGIVILLPVALTITFVRVIVLNVNKVVLDPLINFLAPTVISDHGALLSRIIVFFLVICSVAIVGWGTRIIFIKRIFTLGENIFLKVPIMGKIYNAVKQIFSSFFGHGKTIFKQVVLIEYPRVGLYSIGFTTGTTKGEVGDTVGEKCINIFVPTTPNPTSGIFLIVPNDNISFLNMSVEDGMKLVISGGSVSPSVNNKSE